MTYDPMKEPAYRRGVDPWEPPPRRRCLWTLVIPDEGPDEIRTDCGQTLPDQGVPPAHCPHCGDHVEHPAERCHDCGCVFLPWRYGGRMVRDECPLCAGVVDYEEAAS